MEVAWKLSETCEQRENASSGVRSEYQFLSNEVQKDWANVCFKKLIIESEKMVLDATIGDFPENITNLRIPRKIRIPNWWSSEFFKKIGQMNGVWIQTLDIILMEEERKIVYKFHKIKLNIRLHFCKIWTMPLKPLFDWMEIVRSANHFTGKSIFPNFKDLNLKVSEEFLYFCLRTSTKKIYSDD